MSESFLRYTDLAAAIQLARSRGLTTVQIVRALSANMTYAEALKRPRLESLGISALFGPDTIPGYFP